MIVNECFQQPSQIPPGEKLAIHIEHWDDDMREQADVDAGITHVCLPSFRSRSPPLSCSAGQSQTWSCLPVGSRQHHDNPASGAGREFEPQEGPGVSFERGKSYIKSDVLVARLIEKRDLNFSAVDYDLDSDDEEVLCHINRADERASIIEQDPLSIEEMEAVIHALEVASFEIMMQHVEVPSCMTYMDSNHHFLPLVFHNRSHISHLSSPLPGPANPVDQAPERESPAAALLLHQIKGRKNNSYAAGDAAGGALNIFSQKRFCFFLGSEFLFEWAPTGRGTVPTSSVAAKSRQDALVKRSPPREMNEAEELGVCAVCLNDGAEEGIVIILCYACGIAVHQVDTRVPAPCVGPSLALALLTRSCAKILEDGRYTEKCDSSALSYLWNKPVVLRLDGCTWRRREMVLRELPIGGRKPMHLMSAAQRGFKAGGIPRKDEAQQRRQTVVSRSVCLVYAGCRLRG